MSSYAHDEPRANNWSSPSENSINNQAERIDLVPEMGSVRWLEFIETIKVHHPQLWDVSAHEIWRDFRNLNLRHHGRLSIEVKALIGFVRSWQPRYAPKKRRTAR